MSAVTATPKPKLTKKIGNTQQINVPNDIKSARKLTKVVLISFIKITYNF